MKTMKVRYPGVLGGGAAVPNTAVLGPGSDVSRPPALEEADYGGQATHSVTLQ